MEAPSAVILLYVHMINSIKRHTKCYLFSPTFFAYLWRNSCFRR